MFPMFNVVPGHSSPLVTCCQTLEWWSPLVWRQETAELDHVFIIISFISQQTILSKRAFACKVYWTLCQVSQGRRSNTMVYKKLVIIFIRRIKKFCNKKNYYICLSVNIVVLLSHFLQYSDLQIFSDFKINRRIHKLDENSQWEMIILKICS